MVMEVIGDAQRNADTEAWLDEHGIAWTFEPELALASIDVAASMANQARLEAVVEEVVDRYAADMERGDQFPAVVVNRRPRAKTGVLIGGNHRTAAAGRVGRSTVPAYVVEVAPAVAQRLAYEDNRRHGLPPGEAERILQAIHLVQTGASQGEAARVVGLSLGKVQRGIGTVRADARAKELGIEGWGDLSPSKRWRLSSIEDSSAFAAAAGVVIRTGMSVEDVYSLVVAVNAKAEVADQLRLIGDEGASRQSQGRHGDGVRTSTPRARMLDALRVVGSLTPAQVVAGCVSDDQRHVLAERIMVAARILQATHQGLTS